MSTLGQKEKQREVENSDKDKNNCVGNSSDKQGELHTRRPS